MLSIITVPSILSAHDPVIVFRFASYIVGCVDELVQLKSLRQAVGPIYWVVDWNVIKVHGGCVIVG